MSLDKAIRAGKEHRQPYRRAAAIDPACRHQRGGTPCPWCRSNRTITTQRLLERAKDDLTTHIW